MKNVKFVELGKYRMETWYYSPFPKASKEQASKQGEAHTHAHGQRSGRETALTPRIIPFHSHAWRD